MWSVGQLLWANCAVHNNFLQLAKNYQLNSIHCIHL